MHHLCDCCGGAVDSFISVFTHFHMSGFNLDFETFLSQFDLVDLWQRKGKISGCLKNNTAVVL